MERQEDAIRTFVVAVFKRWRLIVAISIVGLLAAAATWSIRPPYYTAYLVTYISTQNADTTQTAYQGAQLSEQRVTSYIQLISSSRVASDVILELGLDTTPGELSREISAGTTADSVVINIVVEDRSAEQAARIANAVGLVFARLVDELERPALPGAVPAVAVKVVQPAAIPLVPSTTSLPVTLAVGLLGGLVVGFVAAAARQALDRSVRTTAELERVAEVPCLGEAPLSKEVPKSPVVVRDHPNVAISENIRQIRTNLRYLDIDSRPRSIVVTSSVQEEGKSTTALNLAVSSAVAGARTVLVDADLRRPSLAKMLGIEATVGLTTVLSGRMNLRQAVQDMPALGVSFLASGKLPPNPSELLGSAQMAKIVGDLSSNYDIVIIDSPPVLPVSDTSALAPTCDGVIFVCRFERTSSTQVHKSVSALRAVGSRVLGSILTMGPVGEQESSYYVRGTQNSR